MLKLRPPQHGIDDPVEWVSPLDCWDNDRIKREQDAQIAAEVARLPPLPADASAEMKADREKETAALDKAVRGRHPVTVYFTGSTRYSLDADTPALDGGHVAPRDYLTGPATVFEIRSLGHAEYRRADKADDDFETFARLGLVKVSHGGTTYTIERGPDGVSGPWLDALDRASRGLLFQLGMAVFRLCQQGSVNVSEGKP